MAINISNKLVLD